MKKDDSQKTMPSGDFGGTETMKDFEGWVEANRVGCKDGDAIVYDIVCLLSESGELASELKRAIFGVEVRHLPEAQADFRERILLEAGDILHYLSRVLADIGSNFDECANANIEKLTNRMKYGKGQKGLRS